MTNAPPRPSISLPQLTQDTNTVTSPDIISAASNSHGDALPMLLHPASLSSLRSEFRKPALRHFDAVAEMATA